MYYEDFLQWCIDTSREDRSRFLRELPEKLSSLLYQRATVRCVVEPVPHRLTPFLREAKMAKMRLTNGKQGAS